MGEGSEGDRRFGFLFEAVARGTVVQPTLHGRCERRGLLVVLNTTCCPCELLRAGTCPVQLKEDNECDKSE